MKRLGLLLVAVGCWLVLTGCHSLPKQVYSVTVSPQSGSVTQMGQKFQFEATAKVGDRNGSAPEDVTATATWKSSTPTVVVTQSDGYVKAVGCGTATITADYGGQIGQAQFNSTCTQGSPANTTLQSITVYPVTPTIAEVGQSSQFAALGTYSDSTTVDLTHSVTWSSSSTPIATISSTGLATATACGTTTISAQDGAVIGQTVLTVSCLVPTRVQLVIVKTGSTAASIVSSPVGIDCGLTCDNILDYGLGVTLTATPPPASWQGCDQVLSGNVCSLTVVPGAPANDPSAPQAACSNNPSTCRQVTANY